MSECALSTGSHTPCSHTTFNRLKIGFVVKWLENFTHSLANWLCLNNFDIVGGVLYLLLQALCLGGLYPCQKKRSSQGEVDY